MIGRTIRIDGGDSVFVLHAYYSDGSGPPIILAVYTSQPSAQTVMDLIEKVGPLRNVAISETKIYE